MVNWFPLYKKLMEDSGQFKALTPVEKLYFWLLISEFNARGPFYRADLEFAVTLAVSEDKIRRARRKLQKLGWIKVRPGFQSKGKNVATFYEYVAGAAIVENEHFAQIHRYAYEAMLAKLRRKVFSHADIVTYVYLAYLFWKNRGKSEGKFYVTKAVLRDMTNIPDAPARVAKLHKSFTFAGGAHLFEYKDQYHRLLFMQWNFFSDPSEDENNRALAERYREEVKKAVEELKKKATGRIDPEDLPRFYEKAYGGGYRLGYRQKAELINLGKQHGAEKIRDKISAFFKSSKPVKTFPFFIDWLREAVR